MTYNVLTFKIFGIACMVCRAGSMQWLDLHPSVSSFVCPSVCSSMTCSNNSMSQANAGSGTLSAYVAAEHRLVVVTVIFAASLQWCVADCCVQKRRRRSAISVESFSRTHTTFATTSHACTLASRSSSLTSAVSVARAHTAWLPTAASDLARCTDHDDVGHPKISFIRLLWAHLLPLHQKATMRQQLLRQPCICLRLRSEKITRARTSGHQLVQPVVNQPSLVYRYRAWVLGRVPQVVSHWTVTSPILGSLTRRLKCSHV